MTSRIKRWTGVDLGDDLVLDAIAGAVTIAPPRIGDALRTALAALEAAHAKRERADRRRHVFAAVEAAVGLGGLGALVVTLLANAPQVNPGFVALLSLAAAVPGVVALAWATTGGRREAEEISAVETARTVAVQAAALARALETATRVGQAEPGAKTTASAVADEVLAHIEHTAAALEGRERRIDIEHGLKARRHVRIKPVNDRIAVTTESGLTVIAQLVDVSISGAMIAGSLPDVRVGDTIRVGSRAAIVVRTVERGVACEFVEPLPAYSLAPNVVL